MERDLSKEHTSAITESQMACKTYYELVYSLKNVQGLYTMPFRIKTLIRNEGDETQ